MNPSDYKNAGHDVHILAMQARALICILEDLMEGGDDQGLDVNLPYSYTQKRWACVRSLRMHVDAMAHGADAAPSIDAAPATQDRAYLTRKALGHLLMASMEMHTATGRTDAAYVLTEKALTAIGALRIMTNGGRVQP